MLHTLYPAYKRALQAKAAGHRYGAYDAATTAQLIEGYLLASFRACWSHRLAQAFIELWRRERIAEGLSIGIERCVLRNIGRAYPWGPTGDYLRGLLAA